MEREERVCLYLLLGELPVVGLQLVQLVKLNADVFYRELEQIPEAGQVLRRRPGIGVGVLARGKRSEEESDQSQV